MNLVDGGQTGMNIKYVKEQDISIQMISGKVMNLVDGGRTGMNIKYVKEQDN